MADKKLFEGLKAAAKKGVANIDTEALKDKALKASSTIAEKAGDLKDLAVETKADVQEKLTEMDRMLEEATTEYNDSYTLMNDAGIQLFVERMLCQQPYLFHLQQGLRRQAMQASH